MKSVVTVIGARPQFIKAAPVSRALRLAGLSEKIIHTGQHFDDNMSKVFFDEMDIPKPAYNLGIHSLSHGAMTGRMMVEIEKILIEERPDYVLVYGDTNSTLAAAIAAKKLQIKVAHVEAGLRSYNREMPEEINRIVTDQVSDFLFCPTSTAVDNAFNEGLDSAEILLTGDVMYDAMLLYSPNSTKPVGTPDGPYILLTIHRQENTDDSERFQMLVDAINKISDKHQIIFPVHPRTKSLLDAAGVSKKIHLIDPVGYLEMLYLIGNSSLVMTDSGGLQKEAFFHNKFCITLREETEWVELVDGGYNIIAGTNFEVIIKKVDELFGARIKNPPEYYGSGTASQIIAKALLNVDSSEAIESIGGALPDKDLRSNLGCG